MCSRLRKERRVGLKSRYTVCSAPPGSAPTTGTSGPRRPPGVCGPRPPTRPPIVARGRRRGRIRSSIRSAFTRGKAEVAHGLRSSNLRPALSTGPLILVRLPAERHHPGETNEGESWRHGSGRLWRALSRGVRRIACALRIENSLGLQRRTTTDAQQATEP